MIGDTFSSESLWRDDRWRRPVCILGRRIRWEIRRFLIWFERFCRWHRAEEEDRCWVVVEQNQRSAIESCRQTWSEDPEENLDRQNKWWSSPNQSWRRSTRRQTSIGRSISHAIVVPRSPDWFPKESISFPREDRGFEWYSDVRRTKPNAERMKTKVCSEHVQHCRDIHRLSDRWRRPMCRSSRGITSECRSCVCRIYSQVSILRCRRNSKHLSKDTEDRSFLPNSPLQSYIRGEDEKILRQTETNDSSIVAVRKREKNRLTFFASLIGFFDLQSQWD